MEREIKFRAWNSLKNKMIITDFHITCFGIAWKHDDDFDMDNYYTIMQYTGLKDIKGTEVYEGDIIKITSLDKEYPLIDEIHEVRWPSYSVVLYPGDLQEDCDDMQYLTQGDYIYEVIGNIHQNPELL